MCKGGVISSTDHTMLKLSPYETYSIYTIAVQLGLRVLHLAEWAHKKELEQSRARGLPKAAEGAATSLPSSPYGGDGEGPEKNEESQKGSEEPLSAFWRRYNHLLLGKIALLERRDALDEENRALQVRYRFKIQFYFTLFSKLAYF